MTDEDLLLAQPRGEFGSGVIGVCDVCGRRQAVIVLQKERFKLCVLDFLNKTWASSGKHPGAPLPAYRSERIFYPTRAIPGGRAPAVMLTPTKIAKHPIVLVTPDVYGLTTTVLDAALRFASEGFEVLLPDLSNTRGIGASSHLSLRMGARTRGGVNAEAPRVRTLVELYRDGLNYLRQREMVDADKSAIFGASYGGSLAALVAAQEPRLAALVLAYPMPVRPSETLRLLTPPSFVIAPGADGPSSRFLADWSQARASGAAGPELFEVAGARAHFLARDLPAYDLRSAESAWTQALLFLRRQLLPPPPKPPTPPPAMSAPAGTVPPRASPAGPVARSAGAAAAAAPAPTG